MGKNTKLSQLDPNQHAQLMFDPENDAQRVVIVGGEGITLNADVKVPEVKTIEIPVVVKESSVQTIEVQKVVTENRVDRIEVPVIVKEQEIRTIEVPKIIVEHEIHEIQVPVVIEKFKEFPKTLANALIAQAVVSMGLIVVLLVMALRK